MPGCAVATCKNHNKNTKNTDVRYFRFPQNVDLSKQWEISCQRKNKLNLKHARICSIHFEESGFEISLKHRLLKYNPKNSRILKSYTVPTLHLPGSSQNLIHNISDRVSKKENKRLVANRFKKSEMESKPSTSREHPYHALHTSVEMESQPSTSREHPCNAPHTTLEHIGLTDVEVDKLKEKIKILEKENEALLKQVKMKNETSQKYENILAAIFTPGQIKKLLNPEENKKIPWVPEDIASV